MNDLTSKERELVHMFREIPCAAQGRIMNQLSFEYKKYLSDEERTLLGKLRLLDKRGQGVVMCIVDHFYNLAEAKETAPLD